MKIAIYHNLPSGGGLLHLSDVVRALKEAGHELHFYRPTCAETDFCSFIDCINEHYEYPRKLWKPTFSILNPFLYKSYLKKIIEQDRMIASAINKGSYDGIYVGQCQIWTEPPLLKYLNPSLKSFLYCQEPKRSFYEKRFLDQIAAWPWWKKLWRLPTINWMKQCQLEHIRSATIVFCNSAFSKQNVLNAYSGVNPEICHIGVDTDVFCPLDLPEGKHKQLVSIGALDPSKNHMMAIEVAALKPGGYDFKVVIVSDRSFGDTADQLRKRAEETGVELEIKVRIETMELAKVLRDSYSVIYCPLMEPFGIVSIEAQASGTPVLGRDEGGIKETLLNGIGGYRLLDNPNDYAKKINEWLKSPSEYEKIYQQAREHALKNWDKKTLMNKTKRRIEGILENK